MSNARIITVSNQKGGVGKTNVVRNLSYALYEQGIKVLTVAVEPKMSRSTVKRVIADLVRAGYIKAIVCGRGIAVVTMAQRQHRSIT